MNIKIKLKNFWDLIRIKNKEEKFLEKMLKNDFYFLNVYNALDEVWYTIITPSGYNKFKVYEIEDFGRNIKSWEVDRTEYINKNSWFRDTTTSRFENKEQIVERINELRELWVKKKVPEMISFFDYVLNDVKCISQKDELDKIIKNEFLSQKKVRI